MQAQLARAFHAVTHSLFLAAILLSMGALIVVNRDDPAMAASGDAEPEHVRSCKLCRTEPSVRPKGWETDRVEFAPQRAGTAASLLAWRPRGAH